MYNTWIVKEKPYILRGETNWSAKSEWLDRRLTCEVRDLLEYSRMSNIVVKEGSFTLDTNDKSDWIMLYSWTHTQGVS